jgi:hypothetical protein
MRTGFVLFAVIFAAPAVATEPDRAGPDWWSLQPLAAVTSPADRGAAHPIDGFVRARLTPVGFKPSPPADRRTLIRRVTFDLTGLPPTPSDVDVFLTDTRPDAYERLVGRLLASPHYGERWARHWLDVVRFSESHGFEYDRLRDHAWRYRDYVIRTLNADKPYAEFVREQVAGDVLAPGTRDGVIATGMLVAGPYDQAGMNSASAVVKGRAREDELEDLLGTVGQTFLAVTINCARCHDHKFDPYSARDYYRMKAVFDGVRPGDRPIDPADALRARETATKRVEEQLTAARREVVRLEAAGRARVVAKRQPGALSGELLAPIARWTFDVDGRDSVGELHAEPKDGARFAGGRLVTDGKKAYAATPPLPRDLGEKTLEAWVYLPTLKQSGGGVLGVQTLRGEVFDSLVFGEKKPLRWLAGSDFFRRTRELAGPDETARPDESIHLAITYAADGRIALYRNGRPYGKGYVPDGATRPVAFKKGESQVLFGLRHTGGGRAFLQAEIDEARLYDRALTADQVAASLRAGVERVSPDEIRGSLDEAERTALAAAEREATRLAAELAVLRRPALIYAANPKEPGPTLFLKRGDFEKPGEPVTAGSPAVIKGPPTLDLPANAPEGERRRRFADWLTHHDHPLTWRVMVNRVWQHHFGDGLVRTPNDFGLNGERPTHPELLDWLAAWFRDSGGRLKPLHRLIVTSEAYRQASAHDEAAATKDGDNRLLWRYAPRRLEAEAVRDAMLAVSGKLDRTAGGPSARPFRIETFNSAFYIPFDADTPNHNRRSVYRMNVTSSRDPVLDVLDCPDPSVKTPRRNTTTTPLQALTLMNNPFTDRMARAFAERVSREAGADDRDRVTLAYGLAFGRRPSAAEVERAARVAGQVGMKAVCWALLNASEFVYVK